MIKVSVNAGTFAKGGGRALDNLEALQQIVEHSPTRLRTNIQRAGRRASALIEKEVLERGAPGKYVGVEYKKYGPFGLKLVISADGKRGVGTGSTEWSDPVWAGRVFLASERGQIGRRSFTLPARGFIGAYRISHSSQQWKEGTVLMGPLSIPEIGAFYFSGRRDPLDREAYSILVETLNEYNANFLSGRR